MPDLCPKTLAITARSYKKHTTLLGIKQFHCSSGAMYRRIKRRESERAPTREVSPTEAGYRFPILMISGVSVADPSRSLERS